MGDTVQIIVGLAALAVGAEFLVRGASRIARAAGLSPLVVGLTVVAFGTSAPELAVSVKAALAGQPDIAVGNVIGSNIFNVLFILGVSSLIAPLSVSRQLVRLDVPVMIAVSGLAWVLALNASIARAEGALLLAGCIVYTVVLIHLGRKSDPTPQEEPQPDPRSIKGIADTGVLPSVVFVAVGLVLLALGGRWLVTGAANVARSWGASELMIGLTLVSAGTSLPEVATSVVATIKGERDIAVGNVVGSNIFNVLGILGATALMANGVAISPAVLRFDIPIMFATTLACLPIFFTGARISRGEGFLFLGYYVTYVAFLVMADSEHAALPTFSAAMLLFVLPATAMGMGLSFYHALRSTRLRASRSA